MVPIILALNHQLKGRASFSFPADRKVVGSPHDVLAVSPNSFEQNRGGFVGAAFLSGKFRFSRDQFPSEGFGEDGLGKLVGAFSGCRHAFFDSVGEFEEGFHPADDFALFFDGWNCDLENAYIPDVNALSSLLRPGPLRSSAVAQVLAARETFVGT